MTRGVELVTGWLVTGFEAQVLLWCWAVAVLLYGVFRSVARPDPDAIRPSGPID